MPIPFFKDEDLEQITSDDLDRMGLSRDDLRVAKARAKRDQTTVLEELKKIKKARYLRRREGA